MYFVTYLLHESYKNTLPEQNSGYNNNNNYNLHIAR